MEICEYEFINEDNEHPGYSMTEIDFYFWIPAKFHKEYKNHRLTLWKNLRTNKFELVKVFMNQIVQPIKFSNQIGLMIANSPTKEDVEVVFANESLKAVLEEAQGLGNKFHKTKQRYDVCTHSGHELFCFKNKFSK